MSLRKLNLNWMPMILHTSQELHFQIDSRKNLLKWRRSWRSSSKSKLTPLLTQSNRSRPMPKFWRTFALRRETNVPKKVFLAANISQILSNSMLVKYKDPDCPPITCTMSIWNTIIGKVMLDLGASVNLLPYSVYKQLGIGELKPIKIHLQLADMSVKIPRRGHAH